MTVKKTLILKTGRAIPVLASEMGDFEHWIRTSMDLSTTETLVTAVFEGQVLPNHSEISSIVISGSPAMVTEELGWIQTSEEYILSAITAKIPVLGICFGHQLLAQALGGTVGWHPQGREIGTTDITLTPDSSDDPVFRNMPAHFPVHVTHMQTITHLPEGAKVLAGNNFESHHSVRFADNTWGVQFHPEFDENIMRGYIKARYHQIDEEGLDPQSLLSSVHSTPKASQLLQNFADFCRQSNKAD